jgi:hypothetical protein
MINKKIDKDNMANLVTNQNMGGGESKSPREQTVELGECDICCHTFNKSSRQKVQCGKCQMNFCKKCVRKYLTENTNDAHCMNCNVAWDRKFLQESLNKSYYNKEYKEHRKNLLFDGEKARFIETMPHVEDYKNLNKYKKDLDEKMFEICKLEYTLRLLKNEKDKINNEIRRINLGQYTNEAEEKRKFVKKCPADGCEGFLSTQWKCGVCGVWVCPDCFEIKGYQKDVEHTCDEAAKATAQLIKDETKPCPDCGIRIYKISGCDQMWCTSCHVAFSWNTGRKVHGVIHNPHFYQYQRDNNMNIANPGAIACGGVPLFNVFRRAVTRDMEYRWLRYINMNDRDARQKFVEITNGMWFNFPSLIKKYIRLIYLYEKEDKSVETFVDYLSSIQSARGVSNSIQNSLKTILWMFHRGAQHLQHTILARLRTRQQQQRDNRDLRIRFLCNEIDEKHMKSNLLTRDTAFQKRQEILHIYELMGAVNNEILTHLVALIQRWYAEFPIVRDFGSNEVLQQKLKDFCQSFVEDVSRMERVRKYCNVELCKISVNYNQKVQIIAFDRTTPSIDKKMAKLELTKDTDTQGNFMNKIINGTIRFDYVRKDNAHLEK